MSEKPEGNSPVTKPEKVSPVSMEFAVALAITLFVVLGLAACTSFDLGDVIRAETPIEIQQSEGLPSRLTVNRAQEQFKAWHEDQVRVAATWKGEIERQAELVGMLNQIGLQGISEYGPQIFGSFPVLGPIVPGLVGLATFVAGRGSGRKKERQEKDKEISLLQQVLNDFKEKDREERVARAAATVPKPSSG